MIALSVKNLIFCIQNQTLEFICIMVVSCMFCGIDGAKAVML